MNSDRRFFIFAMTHQHPTEAADHIVVLEDRVLALEDRLRIAKGQLNRHGEDTKAIVRLLDAPLKD